MSELLSALLGIAACAAVLWLAFRLFATMPDDPELLGLIAGRPRQLLDTGPQEPCWTEEIGRDGGFIYARSQCPDDLLMELDERAGRNDFPIPNISIRAHIGAGGRD